MRRRAGIAYLLLFVSGAAALGYQMVWTRLFATGLGHETPAMLAIVCAFMAGNALGAWALDRPIGASANPLRFYAALELVIGAWSAGSAFLIPPANSAAVSTIGLEPSPVFHWLVSFAMPVVALLPATAAMGATLPAMERFVATLKPGGREVGAVYAANTFGAVAGTLVATFILAPSLGFSRTIFALAAASIACGIVAFLFSTGPAGAMDQSPRRAGTQGALSPVGELTPRRALISLFVTGLLGIGFEVAGTRVLSQVLENTIYTFAAVLSVYLLGTAAGAALYQTAARRAIPRQWIQGGAADNGSLTLSILVSFAAVSCLLGEHALAHAAAIDHWMRKLGDSIPAVLCAEAAVAAAVFGLPTLVMGALFSHLAQSVQRERGRIGSALAVNTLGGALAPALFGVALLPLLGSKWMLVAVAVGYLPLARPCPRFPFFAAAGAVLISMLPQNLHVVSVPNGGRLVAFHEGVMASVAVVEDQRGDRVLRVNNRFQMGGTAATDAQYRGADLPLLLHPSPHRALFLGLGTGITLGGAVAHPNLQIDGVELVPEVLQVMPLFEPQNRAPARKAGVHLFVADARRYVRATPHRYDVIVADLFHPARDGAGALYTVEHYRAMRACLAPGGLACQWLPLHQLDTGMLQVVVESFRQAFPVTEAFLLRFNVDVPVLGLVGRAEAASYATNFVEQRLADPALHEDLRRLALADSLRVLGHFTDLGNTAAPRLNTDDQPVVTFGAPQFVYQQRARPYESLLPLIERTARKRPAVPLASDPNDAFAARLDTYITARNIHLHGLIDEAEGRLDEALRQYVESARVSEEFTSGYAQCLGIAAAVSKSNPAKARAILEALVSAQPSRPVARQMLERMSGP